MAETIVVIDDHQETANLVSVILKREGYRVFTENSGAAGLVTAEQQHPNLILLDVMMPDMDGLETCRRIRKTEAIKDVPVILFTAKNQADEKWQGFQAGATDYLTKPTNADELKSHTVNSVSDPSKLAIQLKTIKEREVAMTDGEYDDEVAGVTVPLKNEAGAVIAAITVYGPTFRLRPFANRQSIIESMQNAIVNIPPINLSK